MEKSYFKVLPTEVFKLNSFNLYFFQNPYFFNFIELLDEGSIDLEKTGKFIYILETSFTQIDHQQIGKLS